MFGGNINNLTAGYYYVEVTGLIGSCSVANASFEITDIPLISRVAKTKKPLFMSTGMASEAEIEDAVQTARSHGAESILLFHCISSYISTF